MFAYAFLAVTACAARPEPASEPDPVPACGDFGGGLGKRGSDACGQLFGPAEDIRPATRVITDETGHDLIHRLRLVGNDGLRANTRRDDIDRSPQLLPTRRSPRFALTLNGYSTFHSLKPSVLRFSLSAVTCSGVSFATAVLSMSTVIWICAPLAVKGAMISSLI
jgi:hypothetical protein